MNDNYEDDRNAQRTPNKSNDFVDPRIKLRKEQPEGHDGI